MANPFVNKKKVRGWKRQIKKLQRWKHSHIQLDLNRLNHSGFDYVKIWLDPWDRLVKRNPPIWYRRLILGAMFEIYKNWQSQIKTTGEPFYLRIWLFEPRFYDSQVVVAIGQKIDWYENLFAFPKDKNLSLMGRGYEHPSYNLQEFSWELRVDTDIYSEEDDELTVEDVTCLKGKAFSIDKIDNGKTIYTVKRGHVWIGSCNSI